MTELRVTHGLAPVDEVVGIDRLAGGGMWLEC